MKNFRNVVIIFAATSLILACDIASTPTVTAPDQQSVSTMVAGTIQAITAAAPLATQPAAIQAAPTSPVATTAPAQNSVQGTKVSFENVSLVIPSGLGTGANTVQNDDVEMPPFVNPSNGPMPQHVVITINGYPLPGQARIAVFKASEYAGYTDFTKSVISELQSFSFQSAGSIPQDLGSTFQAQAAAAAIQNGHGLRYVTEIMQAPVPISSDETYYYYQGMTNDGAYFVMAVFPIGASFLAPTGDSSAAIPSGGIQFPPFSNPNATSNDINSYYDAVTQKMDAAAPSDFTPSLATLDALIQSISVNP